MITSSLWNSDGNVAFMFLYYIYIYAMQTLQKKYAEKNVFKNKGVLIITGYCFLQDSGFLLSYQE